MPRRQSAQLAARVCPTFASANAGKPVAELSRTIEPTETEDSMNGPKTASLVISAFVLVPIVAGAQVYVSVAPPPAIVEARAPSPGTGYLWIAGNWSWNGTRHVWRAGRWEQQPPAAARYVGPQWRRTGQGWRVDDGRWVNRRGATVTVDAATGQPPVAAAIQPPPTNVEVRLAPPAPITELQPNSPGNGYTWIPGFWNWDGRRYVWAAGHWEQPPNASA